MPTRNVSRLERHDVLVLQFRQNLVRRRNSARHIADHQQIAACPCRQIRQRAMHRRRRRTGFIFHSRADHHDVDGHVHGAGNRRNLSGRHAACGIHAVGDHHERTPALPARNAFGGFSDCIPQRRCAERLRGGPCLIRGLERGRKRTQLLQFGIKRKQRCLIHAGLQSCKQEPRRFTGALQFCGHAAADIEQQRDASRTGLGPHADEWRAPAGIQQLEIARAEVPHQFAFSISNDGCQGHSLHSGLEQRLSRLLRGDGRNGDEQHDASGETANVTHSSYSRKAQQESCHRET